MKLTRKHKIADIISIISFVIRSITLWIILSITIIGLPTTPEFGDLISGPNAGEITITLKTKSSGISDHSSEVFWFVVIPVHEGIRGESVSHLSMNYQSDTLESVVISGLAEGESYTLNATATNVYGSSQVATSISITAGIFPCGKLLVVKSLQLLYPLETAKSLLISCRGLHTSLYYYQDCTVTCMV